METYFLVFLSIGQAGFGTVCWCGLCASCSGHIASLRFDSVRVKPRRFESNQGKSLRVGTSQVESSQVEFSQVKVAESPVTEETKEAE